MVGLSKKVVIKLSSLDNLPYTWVVGGRNSGETPERTDLVLILLQSAKIGIGIFKLLMSKSFKKAYTEKVKGKKAF